MTHVFLGIKTPSMMHFEIKLRVPQATHDFLVPRDVQVKVISRTASHKIPGFVTQHVYYFGDCCCFLGGAGCVWKLGAFETTFVLGPKVVRVDVCIVYTGALQH